MYSGTTLTAISGRILGAHQKIDRVARNDLRALLIDDNLFPATREILRFEGTNGPDGIKRKSPSHNEPWHYIDPYDENDSRLLELISNHYAGLVTALRSSNRERAAFEAAWLAHAIVDGLTPAHHYPYEAELTELRGEGIETRTSLKHKLVLPGQTRRKQVRNNWKMWGPGGLLTTHGFFELGVASLIAPLPLKKAMPSAANIAAMHEQGLKDYFLRIAREISALGLYEEYYKRGWTTRLAHKVRKVLAPRIIETVTLAWYSALIDAGLAKAGTHADH